MKKLAKWLIIIFAPLYIIGCGALYVMQDEIIFRPTTVPDHTQYRFGREISIPVAEDVNLHALYSETNNPKGVILYLHGNRGNARRCQRQAEMFAGYGYNVLLLDYRGYGKSDGQIHSGSELYGDVQKVYDFLKEEFNESDIVLAGYSIGTGMASYLAAENNPSRLILIAPYVSMTNMKDRFIPFVPDFLVRFPLDNKKHISQLHCPVTLFHGTEDEVIPYEASQILEGLYPTKVKLVALAQTGHRGAIFHGAIKSHLKEYLQ